MRLASCLATPASPFVRVALATQWPAVPVLSAILRLQEAKDAHGPGGPLTVDENRREGSADREWNVSGRMRKVLAGGFTRISTPGPCRGRPGPGKSPRVRQR